MPEDRRLAELQSGLLISPSPVPTVCVLPLRPSCWGRAALVLPVSLPPPDAAAVALLKPSGATFLIPLLARGSLSQSAHQWPLVWPPPPTNIVETPLLKPDVAALSSRPQASRHQDESRPQWRISTRDSRSTSVALPHSASKHHGSSQASRRRGPRRPRPRRDSLVWVHTYECVWPSRARMSVTRVFGVVMPMFGAQAR